MKRLFGSARHRLALQLGLLGGIAAALAVGTHEAPLRAEGPDCPQEGECTFKRPNILLIMDYSTSMNEVWDDQNNLTRWQVVVDSITTMTQPGSFLSQNTHLALMRFGHDPNAALADTPIPGDASGLLDGRALDVPWYDPQSEPWYVCNGAAIAAALEAAGDPLDGSLVGIGSWTKGALDYAKTLIDQSIADHPEDGGERMYLNVVVTQGAWTSIDGTQTFGPPDQDPGPSAAELFDSQGVSTYVVAVAGDPQAEQAADALAVAGGTGPTALAGDTPALLEQALADVVQNIIDDVVAPECSGGMPRVMVLLDASSSMLNVDGGTMAGGFGMTGWDQAREALAGADSLFSLELVMAPGFAVEDVVQLGLAVFGHDTPAPGEQKLLVQYGPCRRDHFAWALDPYSSCELPGCDDPWGGPPITWTFQDGSLSDPPGFEVTTLSHMPQCGGNQPFCAGSGAFLHLGLDLIDANRLDYVEQCSQMGAEFPCDASTRFVNILITNGQYAGYSTDAQVQTALVQMFNAGVTTHVIGFGDGVDTPQAIQQLDQLAGWGSGNALVHYDAGSQALLAQALADIVESIEFDPCCAFEDCSAIVKPTTSEPDPVPSDTTTGDTGGTTASTTGVETTAGDTSETASTSGDTLGDGNDEVGLESSTGTSSGVGGDAGCSCAAPKEGGARELAGALLLGLVGFVRRRR